MIIWKNLPNAKPTEAQERALNSGYPLHQYDTPEIIIRYLTNFCEGGGLYEEWQENEPRPSFAACAYPDSAIHAFRAAGRIGGLVRADFRMADLRFMPLNGLDFQAADLSGSKLNAADMANARLYQVNISGADLTDTKNLAYAYGIRTSFYYRGDEPKGLAQACRSLAIDCRPMALNKKDFTALCRLSGDPKKSDRFSENVQRLRNVFDQKIANSQR